MSDQTDICPANQSTHAGTIADPIPRRVLYMEPDEKGDPKIYTIVGGGDSVLFTTATDELIGIVKLTDNPELEAPAKTGYTAITPNGVRAAVDSAKTEITEGIQDSVDSAIDNALTEGGKLDTALDEAIDDALADGGKLDTAIDDAIQDKIDSGEIGTGGGSGEFGYVVKPTITTPTDNQTSVSVVTTINATAYLCVVDSWARDYREFQLSKSDTFSDPITHTANIDSWQVSPKLDPNTVYYIRVRDVATSGYKSAWSNTVKITTGNSVQIVAPTLTLSGYAGSPSDIGPNFSVSASAFTVDDGSSDTHVSTSWYIDDATRAGTHVWESLNDTTNKTSINISAPLQPATQYTLTCIYHGTLYGDSAPAVVPFTTASDFGTVVTPTISVSGAPNDVGEKPTLTSSAFANSRDPDTHDMSDWKITPAAGGASVWESLNDTTHKTSITVTTSLQTSTAYKAYVRHHGATYGWSDWGEVQFTTAATFSPPAGDIGSIVDGTFGVGTAPKEVYESLGLSELPGTHDPTSFQYGLYTVKSSVVDSNSSSSGMQSATREHIAYVKYIPKFYYAFLTNYTTGELLPDDTLADYAAYSGVSVELLKQAQTRSPNYAIVIAPGSAFADEEEANLHGFILHRAFIDGGKVMPGFFIANSLACYFHEYTSTGNHYWSYYYGVPEFGFTDGYAGKYNIKGNHRLLRLYNTGDQQFDSYKFDSSVTLGTAVTWCRKFEGFNLATIFMWSAISMLSFAAGLYCKDATECAWYKEEGDSSPRGINTNGSSDNVDSAVVSETVSSELGFVFVDSLSQYAKTTHNGTISGITNVNGWLWQPLLGIDGYYSKIMPESTKLSDVTTAGQETTLSLGSIGDAYPSWGSATGVRAWVTDVNSNGRALCGVEPRGSTSLKLPSSASEARLFGNDSVYRRSGGAVPVVGGDWSNGAGAGVFGRSCGSAWSRSSSNCGVRLAGYPKVS